MPDKHVSDSVAASTPLVSAGLQILQLAIDTHLITSHFALPLVIRDPVRRQDAGRRNSPSP